MKVELYLLIPCTLVRINKTLTHNVMAFQFPIPGLQKILLPCSEAVIIFQSSGDYVFYLIPILISFWQKGICRLSL